MDGKFFFSNLAKSPKIAARIPMRVAIATVTDDGDPKAKLEVERDV